MARRIQACLNGARAVGFHPALPITAEALAVDAARCAAAGVVALHIHQRDAAGEETLEPETVGAAVAAMRRAAPGLPISVSTGDWIEHDDARQIACVRGWAALPAEARPDEASVNLSEPTAPAVMEALLRGGIGVEAGVASLADLDRLLALDLLPLCRRVLVEIDDVEPIPAEALATAILARLDGAPERQLHGFGRSAWPMARRAAALGLMLRLGLEDVAELPDGGVAPGNAALVAAGLAL
ncbi:3-keto-5-aminohexanoate cleavage protein [Falsiroseomonas oryziterrae]|uniref:3-keto-5-aminohexanoate cleavage protein n=1 Tax=Falsiroseomonas oryziterrae TaxID=2911368 RepID=UPI001F0119EE|nr:3-keto-5-aminohexanoate cleavage protein [Roseomonas sp. NPKOSM-4]